MTPGTARGDARPTVELVPLTDALRAQTAAAAAADGHGVVAASHAVIRTARGDARPTVVGYMSLGVVPMLFVWLDSRQVTPRETYAAWRLGADHLQGRGPVCVPCTEASPLRPYLERLGGQRVVTAHLYLKQF